MNMKGLRGNVPVNSVESLSKTRKVYLLVSDGAKAEI